MGDHPEREIQRELALTNPPMHGPDIKALQDAINKILATLKLNGHLAEDGDFGPHTKRLANKAAYALGIHAAGEGSAGPSFTKAEQLLIRNPSKRTREQMERSERRVKELHDRQDRGGAVRKNIIAYCKWGVQNEPQIHYAQIRPYPASPHSLPMSTDCSGFATLAYKQASGPDPNGTDFNGFGFTGTILAHCDHITKAEAQPGDLVVYGAPSGSHVVIVAEDESRCYSHGQEAGPIYITLAAEAAAHSGQAITYCSCL